MKREGIFIKNFSKLPFLKIIVGNEISNSFPGHSHDNYIIGTVTYGLRKMIINNETLIFTKGNIFIVNPYEPHSCCSIKKKHSYIAMVVDRTFICSLFTSVISEINFQNIISSDASLSQMIEKLAVPDTFEIECLFYSIIERILSNYTTKEIHKKKLGNIKFSVNEARKYIDENFTGRITLEKISKLTGASLYYINRVFAMELGMSPYNYLLHKRIEKSKYLLLKGISIVKTAFESGFTDQSHFTKFFKKIIGVTPRQFINSHKNII